MDELMLELFDLSTRDSGAATRIPDHLVREFAGSAATTRKSAKQTIISQTDRSTDVYLIQSGQVEFSQLSPSSKETVFREGGPGEMFGELSALDESLRSLNVTATTDTVLLNMPGGRFRQFLNDNTPFREWLQRSLAFRVRDLSHRVFSLSTMTVPCRIWTELVRRARQIDPVADRVEIRNFPTHSKLAASLGTHREAVSRELSELAKEGIVDQKRRLMTVMSVSKLERMLKRYLS